MCLNQEISKGEDIISQEAEEGSAPDWEGEDQVDAPSIGEKRYTDDIQVDAEKVYSDAFMLMY